MAWCLWAPSHYLLIQWGPVALIWANKEFKLNPWLPISRWEGRWALSPAGCSRGAGRTHLVCVTYEADWVEPCSMAPERTDTLGWILDQHQLLWPLAEGTALYWLRTWVLWYSLHNSLRQKWSLLHINELAQDCGNSSVSAMELHLSTKPSTWFSPWGHC